MLFASRLKIGTNWPFKSEPKSSAPLSQAEWKYPAISPLTPIVGHIVSISAHGQRYLWCAAGPTLRHESLGEALWMLCCRSSPSFRRNVIIGHQLVNAD